MESLEEVIRVAGNLNIPLHVSHVKCIGKKNWGARCTEVLELFRRTREEGVRLDFDLYPYMTGSTSWYIFFRRKARKEERKRS